MSRPLIRCLLAVLVLLLGQGGASAADSASQAAIRRFDAGRMGHPRLFKGQNDVAGIVAATRAERARALASLLDSLRRNSARAISPQLRAQVANPSQQVPSPGWWQQSRELERMGEAAFAWHATHEDWLLDEVRGRMDLFAPPILKRGCRGDVAETRDYAWNFALAYDFAYPALDEDDRARVKQVVLACVRSTLGDTPATMRRAPDNSIVFSALGKLVGALIIMRGDLPEAQDLLSAALPAYLASISPYGGKDGGFGNGSSYALWDAGEQLLVWDLIERVMGIPVYSRPWIKGLPRYLAYALPPGTPAGAFGDGAEVERGEEWARLGKAIALRSSSPLARWYVRQLKGEDYARLHILLSPREARAKAALGKAANGASFPSIGLAAMHSRLADRERVSVLFKSSPYGSLNHSHADQNSFVVYAGGEVMAMDSGAYDSYGSPHWRGWYKQTRAHNAITFDGGEGQQLGKLGEGVRAFNGKLTRFATSAAYDIAVGDARAAYGGDIRQARRSLVFLRPSTLVVVDQLQGGEHEWEWNLHTGSPLVGTPERFKVSVGRQSMCGTLDASAPLALSTTQGYSPAPATKAGPHYWNRFMFRDAASRGVFVAVLRMDCASAPPEISIDGGSASVRVAGRRVTVDGAGVKVAP